MNEEINIYDKRGIPIYPGDTLKIFHFVAAVRREKRYMYKFVQERVKLGTMLGLKISHLSLSRDFYYELLDGKIKKDIEIVQGYHDSDKPQHFRDRKRIKL